MTGVLEKLRNQFDIADVPFTFPGSRILIQKYPGENKLFINLAERLISIFPGLESYLSRVPFISGIQFLDEQDGQLSFEISTSPHLIELKTITGTFSIVFEDTDSFNLYLPDKKTSGILFTFQAVQWKKTTTGCLINSYRSLAVDTNAKILENSIEESKKNLFIRMKLKTEIDQSIRFRVYEGNSLQDREIKNSTSVIRSAESMWAQWFNKAPAVDQAYEHKYLYAWWVLANNLISPKGNIPFKMAVPSKKGYIGAWLWDSALHTIAFRHINPDLARKQIRGMLVHQQLDGMLPDAIFDDGIVTEIDHPIVGKVTKPPILAWAALKIHEMAPDDGFIKEIYPSLVRWNHWWFDENDDDRDGLVQYNHPYSSGMDDHPVWDGGMPVESPDINTYLILQMQSLARMAEMLDKPEDASAWSRKAGDLLKLMIDKLWDESTGMFRSLRNKKPIPTKSIINLLPLWTAHLPGEMNRKIISHMRNDEEFGGDFDLPVVSRDDHDFSPDKMWRGPIWVNMNYFFIEALWKIGKIDQADHLRDQTLKLIMENEGIYEYYNSVTGKPGSHAMPAFSWSAAVFIDLAIQASGENRQGAAKPNEK